MERGDPLRVAGMQPKIPPLLFHTTQTVPSVGLDLKFKKKCCGHVTFI